MGKRVYLLILKYPPSCAYQGEERLAFGSFAQCLDAKRKQKFLIPVTILGIRNKKFNAQAAK